MSLSKNITPILILSSLFLCGSLAAEEKKSNAAGTDSTSSGFNPMSLFKLSGEAGFYGDIYSVTGRDPRRKPSTGRIFLRPTLTFMDNFSISFDIFLSTEGSAASQQINRFAVHPRWSWGTAHAGDFSPELSRYTLSGISLRGAGVDLHPGMIRLALYGGQTQKAIEAGPYGSIYSRHLAAAKVGYGSEEDGFLDLIFVRSKDNTASLPADFSVIDTSGTAGTGYNYGSPVRPQENMVFGLNSFLSTFDGTLQFRGEAAGSIFTSDLYGNAAKLSNVPGFIDKLFVSRVTSTADYSMSLGVMLSHQTVNFRGNYSYIGPGYTSLGLSSSFNDKRTYDAALGLNLLDNRLIIQSNFQLQEDNVLHQKPYTTTGLNYGATANMRPVDDIMITLNMMRYVLSNDNTNDTLRIKSMNSSYLITVISQFRLFDIGNTLTTNYALQTTDDENILRSSMGMKSHNISASLHTVLSKEWSVGPGVSLTYIDMGAAGTYNTSNVNLRITNRSFSGVLSNSISGGFTNSDRNQALNASLQSVLSLKAYGSLSLNVILNMNEIKSSRPLRFVERTARLTYTYRLR